MRGGEERWSGLTPFEKYLKIWNQKSAQGVREGRGGKIVMMVVGENKIGKPP